MPARIVGLGQEWAGDDGIGLAVVRRLRTALSPLPHSVVGEGEGEGSDTLQAPFPAPRSDSSNQGHATIDLVEATDSTQLITLLTDGADPVVIVDAVLDQGPAGRVLLIDAGSDPISTHRLSTHGLGVMESIQLARIAHPTEVARKIFIVGITIQNASRGSSGLSPAIAAAVSIAAAQALKLADKG